MSHPALKELGLKTTGPRIKILQLLETCLARHLSAEDIHRALVQSGEDIALATVYRVLAQFEEAKLVRRHHFEGDSSVFEIDQGDRHDHLVCAQCGQVEEFVDVLLQERREVIARQAGFHVTDHHFTIYGTCARCVECMP